MAIKNPDGSTYKLKGSIQQYNPNSVEFDLFNLWDKEAIQMGGTPIYYYECMIQMNTVDPLYLEDRGKLFSPTPVVLQGWYDPIPSQQSLTMFGFDSPTDEIMIQFNYKNVLEILGHPPRMGSRIFTPHKRENWVVERRNVEEFKLWGELRLQVLCKRFRESRTINDGKVTEKEPDFKIDAI